MLNKCCDCVGVLFKTRCLDAYHKIDKSTSVSAADLTKQVLQFVNVNADVDAMMAADEGFLLGRWLKSSRAVSDWDGSGGSLAGFYEWNSRVQITTWAGGYSRREWSGMVDSYYGGRTKIWLNNSLHKMAVEGRGTHGQPAAVVARVAAAAGTYRAVKGYDCNFHDIQPHHLGLTEAQLEAVCNGKADCIGFNFPHGILKSSCSGWEVSAGDTFYFKPGHVPPHIPPPPTSSCECTTGTVSFLCLSLRFNGAGCVIIFPAFHPLTKPFWFRSQVSTTSTVCRTPSVRPVASTMAPTRAKAVTANARCCPNRRLLPLSSRTSRRRGRTKPGRASLPITIVQPSLKHSPLVIPVPPWGRGSSDPDVANRREATLPSKPVGDPVGLAKKMLAKYQ